MQLLVNAFLHALTGAVLIRAILGQRQAPSDKILAVVLLILFSIPFSWMSILVGFQSQFYYMLLFAVLSIQALCAAKYITGYVLSVLAFLSMTPGAFVLPAFAACLLIDAFRRKLVSRQFVVLLSVSSIMFVVMILSRSGDSSTDMTAASSISDFVISLAAGLWWPFNISNIAGSVVYVPLLILSLRALVDKGVPLSYLALGCFVLLQIIAMAYFRGNGGVPPANRYWEVLLIGVCANMLCAFKAIEIWPGRMSLSIAFSWFIVIAYGMSMLAIASLTTGLPGRLEHSTTAGSLITEYLETGNEGVFSGKDSLDVSHPNTEELVQILSDPMVVSVLPSALAPGNEDSLSAVKESLFKGAPAALFLGLCLFLYGLFSNRKSPIA